MAASPSPTTGADSRQPSRQAAGIKLSDAVRGLLSRVRMQIRQVVLLDAVLIAALCALSIFWLGAMIDYLPVKAGSNETPRWLRGALLAIMGLGLAWTLIWRLGRRLLARLPDRNLAVLLERRFPQLNSQLVTVVDLARQPADTVSNPQAYQAMLERVHQTVTEQVRGLDSSALINWKPIWLLGWLVALLSVFTVAMAAAQPKWFALWSSRLFALSDQPWPRQARLQARGVQLQLPLFTGQLSAERILIPFQANVAHVARGAAPVLNIQADKQAALVPERCTLFYQLGDGSRGSANLQRLGSNATDWQAFMLNGPPLVDIQENVSFAVVGGDARLDGLQLQVVDPAVITSMRLAVVYPQYLSASQANLPPQEQLEFRSGLRIPEGARVHLLGETSASLTDVQYTVRTMPSARSPRKSNKTTETDSTLAATGKPNELPRQSDQVEILRVTPSGNGFDIPLGELRDSVVVEIRLLDQYGLSSDQIPRYSLTVAEDTPPEVDSKLVGIGTAVTPQAVLPVAGKVTDDYGLSRVWSTLIINEDPPMELEVQAAPDGAIDARIDLRQLAEQRGLKCAPESTLGLVVSASDRFDLDGETHLGSGQPVQLAVVTADKLLVLLDRQELELRQRLELIISELTQLREVLQELSRSTDAASRWRRQTEQLAGFVSLNWATPNQGAASDTPQDGAAQSQTGVDPEQQRRLVLLRAQQSVLQGDKSQQELIGVATRVEDIRLQLINNRIDSIDRQARLQDKVFVPLQALLADEVEQLRSRLTQLQSAAMSPAGSHTAAATALEANDRVLVALNAIIANMLDLESFNEIVDLVRGILDDEQRILDETQKKQKEDLLKLLK